MPAVEPVYGLTEGLYPRAVAEGGPGGADARAGAARMDRPADRGPAPRAELAAALHALHKPATPPTSIRPPRAATRLAYDELLANQLALMLVRARMREVRARPGSATARWRKNRRAALRD